MSKVVVDTSAWVEFFRPQGDAGLKEVVKPLIYNGSVLLPGLIRAEILRGTKSTEEYEMLDDLLKGLQYLPVAEDFWERLSLFSFDLLRKGVTVPLTDTYIALVAIENGASLLHRDHHFDVIARETSLDIFEISQQ